MGRVSTHSRPKAAAYNTADGKLYTWFQHTAARRRLHQSHRFLYTNHDVSTHSRPKAAAIFLICLKAASSVSTHSRPKAAALAKGITRSELVVSTHSRPKAAA